MTSLTRVLFCSAALAISVAAVSPVLAQDATLAPMVKAKPKAVKTVARPVPSDRRPGELEGWTPSPASAASSKSKKLPPGVVSEKSLPDGGIPLPEQRDTGFAPPVAIDSNGRPSGMFRF